MGTGVDANRSRRAVGAKVVRHLAYVAMLLMPGCQRDAPRAEPEQKVTQDELVEANNRGVGLMGQFDYGAAVEVFEPLVAGELGPAATGHNAKVNLAIALLNRRSGDDLSRSARLLEDVMEAEPANLRAVYCRGLLYFNNGQMAEASTLFQQVAERDPTDSYAVYYDAQCLFNQGRQNAALVKYQQAAEIDPYLRSAYYGAFQAAQRLDDRQLAEESLATFERLATNPRARLAELKYTRMGPKAAAVAISDEPMEPVAPPAGPVFADPSPLVGDEGEGLAWRQVRPGDSPPNITCADIDGDGQTDLFIANGLAAAESPNAVLLAHGDRFELAPDHPLARIADVNAALWGDLNDDGLVDVYLCRNGANRLMQQSTAGQWADITSASQTSGGDSHTVDGACYDADHDGDLDLLLVQADGPNQLLNNNRDGTFRPLAAELGITGGGRSSRQVLLADLDTDDDVDLLVLHEQPPHELFLNDRFWEYRAPEGDAFVEFTGAELQAAVAADSDVDGQVEIFSLGRRGLRRWSREKSGPWRSRLVRSSDAIGADRKGLAVCDFDGDTRSDLLIWGESGWQLLDVEGDLLAEAECAINTVGILVTDGGPQIIASRSGKPPLVWQSGRGRFPFARLRMVGRKDRSAEMRSNSSGIGVRGAARIDTRWVPVDTLRASSGPGQSLQPLAIGTGGAEQIDFVQLLWPDGVSQSELNLGAGELHVIDETQRQAGSCPLVFAWNGQRYEFIADLLGAGGIGFNLGKGEFYEPRPSENLLLPADLLAKQDGRYAIKLGEPMEEICYFDAIRLVAYDLPPGWRMTLDERFGGTPPGPTGEAVFYRQAMSPVAAVNDRGEDITSEVSCRDRRAAPLDRTDRRFIGLANPHSVTLTFAQPLDEIANPVLVFDGWVEYAYSQSAFAAWQAGEAYIEPTIEAQGAGGDWQVVAERFGYMAGTPRQASVPLPADRLPKGTRRLRISTNMQVYWDRLLVVEAEEGELARRKQLKLVTATVGDVGFSTRTLLDQRYPVYDYDCRPPFGDTRHPRGFYTALGDALELVSTTDDAVAIIGPGEELHLEFATSHEPPPAGWSRRFVLEADGWCKDADLFTKSSGTVAPLPRRGAETTDAAEKRRARLHATYNTRYRAH